MSNTSKTNTNNLVNRIRNLPEPVQWEILKYLLPAKTASNQQAVTNRRQRLQTTSTQSTTVRGGFQSVPSSTLNNLKHQFPRTGNFQNKRIIEKLKSSPNSHKKKLNFIMEYLNWNKKNPIKVMEAMDFLGKVLYGEVTRLPTRNKQ